MKHATQNKCTDKMREIYFVTLYNFSHIEHSMSCFLFILLMCAMRMCDVMQKNVQIYAKCRSRWSFLDVNFNDFFYYKLNISWTITTNDLKLIESSNAFNPNEWGEIAARELFNFAIPHLSLVDFNPRKSYCFFIPLSHSYKIMKIIRFSHFFIVVVCVFNVIFLIEQSKRKFSTTTS